MRSDLPTVRLLGVPVATISAMEALAEIERLVERTDPATLVFVNAQTLNLAAGSENYLDLLRRADLVLNDGSGVAIACRAMRRRFPENLNGTDLTPRVLRLAADRGWGVFLLGGRPTVAERAGATLEQSIPGLRIVGTEHGYNPPELSAGTAQRIRSSGAAVVLVAMGNPRQEEWLDVWLGATGARLGVGVGAFLDFAAGEVPRAPRWMNRCGIEWMYRLMCEPRRLWRRYLLGNLVFLGRVLKEGELPRIWLRRPAE